MKTALFNPIFINPQAYFVFTQLYDIIPEYEVLVEPCAFTGTLMVQTSDNTLVKFYKDTKSIDLSEFANSIITISQYTDIGATVLGQWVLYGKSTPTVDPHLVDAWFMSGLKNEDKPAFIEGVKGNKLFTNNFAFNEISGFNGLGALVFDGVDDKCVCNTMPIMTDYTIIVKRKYVKTDTTKSSILISKRVAGDRHDGAFTLERQRNGICQEISFGSLNNIDSFTNNDITWQTKNKYNGLSIISADVKDSNTLSVANTVGDSYSNVAISWIGLYDISLTEEEINTEIIKLENEHNKRLSL